MNQLADDRYVPRQVFDDLQAKWNDPQALQNRLMDLFIANPTEQAKENLIDWINVSSRLAEMSAKELVDVALAHLSDNVEDHNYELIVEQLCTRVYPNWSNEDPDSTAQNKGNDNG